MKLRMLSEVSQSQKNLLYDYTNMRLALRSLEVIKLIETENRIWLTESRGSGKLETSV